MAADSLNQIVSELELLMCYRCTHDLDGTMHARSPERQDRACELCPLHAYDGRMAAVGFDPLDGFDKELAKRNLGV